MGRVCFEDDALVGVDKPAGVPTQQANDLGVADDLPARLKSFLGARDHQPTEKVYLGIHQRLDRATSGVIAYAKKREANRSLAAQFEGRRVEKQYLAIVSGWPAGKKRTKLEHHLAPGDDGQVRVVPRHVKGAQHAITHVEFRDSREGRTLLALTLETGRTHQARAQLAAVGAPIAGDLWYGDALPAPRLMLHAAALSLDHPLDEKKRVRIRAEMPRAFERFLARGDASPFASIAGHSIDEAAFDDALTVGRDSRFALGRAALLPITDPSYTTAFRLLNEGGDGTPGLALDVYGDHLVAHFYDETAIAAREAILDRLHALGFAGVYVKMRPKQANVIVDSRQESLAPKLPARGSAAEDEIVVHEHGLPYLARLGDGLSTGIFLDQRENRRRVGAMAGGKRVLNLFAYTCPFTVAAAAGGAARTVSVDASKGAIERGQRGLENAGLAGAHHEFVVADVFEWLESARRRGERFDLVILDPPSYSSVGASRFTASGYKPLAALAMGVVAKDGQLLACTNHRQTVRAKLRRLLHEAARDAGREVTQMKDLPAPIDFPPPFGLEAHLKSVLVKLG